MSVCRRLRGTGAQVDLTLFSILSRPQNAIANASTLAEVERLKGLLQSGQIPGRERRPGEEGALSLCYQLGSPGGPPQAGCCSPATWRSRSPFKCLRGSVI